VAFWAHVGGFLVGIVLIKLFPERPRRYRYGAWWGKRADLRRRTSDLGPQNREPRSSWTVRFWL